MVLKELVALMGSGRASGLEMESETTTVNLCP